MSRKSFAKAVFRMILRAKAARSFVVWVNQGLDRKKIAATLASIYSTSLASSSSAVKAFPGDLGMIQAQDIAYSDSYSGETGRVLMRLLPSLKSFGIRASVGWQ